MGKFKEEQKELGTTKEQKTQVELLKYLFGGLYSQLNLEQFITDKEKGSVDIPRLAAYLEFIGFSHETIDFVSEYLEGKVDRQTALTSVEYEYKYNPNIQTKLKEFNELVKSVEKDVSGIIPDKTVRKSVTFYLSLNLCSIHKIDLNSLMANIVISIDKLPMNMIEKTSILSYVTRLEFSDKTKKELSDIQKFKEKELTGDNKIICENIKDIAIKVGETYNTLISSTATEQEKRDALENYGIFLTKLGISENEGCRMLAELAGNASGELDKKGRPKDAEQVYNIAKGLLVGKYGMSLDEFNKSFMEGLGGSLFPGVEGINELLLRASELGPDYLYEYIEKVLRPMFGGTEEMQAGEAVVIKSKPKS